MITPYQYFQGKPHTDEHEDAAADLLARVNSLEAEYTAETGDVLPDDPDTGTPISGSKGGEGDGGFRVPTASTGRALSSHKEAKGVDRYDPENRLDNWITDECLERHGLYREHPDATPGWCHLQTRRPGSGNRTYLP